jgi:hypothetical protein
MLHIDGACRRAADEFILWELVGLPRGWRPSLRRIGHQVLEKIKGVFPW